MALFVVPKMGVLPNIVETSWIWMNFWRVEEFRGTPCFEPKKETHQAWIFLASFTVLKSVHFWCNVPPAFHSAFHGNWGQTLLDTKPCHPPKTWKTRIFFSKLRFNRKSSRQWLCDKSLTNLRNPESFLYLSNPPDLLGFFHHRVCKTNVPNNLRKPSTSKKDLVNAIESPQRTRWSPVCFSLRKDERNMSVGRDPQFQKKQPFSSEFWKVWQDFMAMQTAAAWLCWTPVVALDL